MCQLCWHGKKIMVGDLFIRVFFFGGEKGEGPHNVLKRGKNPFSLKSMFFLNFFWVKGSRSEEKISKNINFSLWVVARLPQRLQLMFFEIFSSLHVPCFGDPPSLEKNSKTLILAFEANKMDFFTRFSSLCYGDLHIH